MTGAEKTRSVRREVSRLPQRGGVSCRRRRWTEGGGSMQRCILVEQETAAFKKSETKPEDLMIAVDGGYDTCRKYDIVRT